MSASFEHPVAVASLLAVVLLSACKSMHPGPLVGHNDGDRIVITEEMIARSGGQTAWEVLRREAPQIAYLENRSGQATSMQRRGASSINLNDSPMLFIDGVRIQEIRTLQQLPASVLLSIEVLTGTEGTTYYGTDAVGGVIVVKTKNGQTP
jgi:outer membrane cobalamin receptor